MAINVTHDELMEVGFLADVMSVSRSARKIVLVGVRYNSATSTDFPG